MPIHATFRLGDESEHEEAHAEETVHDTTTAKSEPHTEQKPKTSPLQPHPEATKFVAALQEWEQASAGALSATDQLIAAMEAADDDLADAIAQVVEQLKADFPDTLDDALTGLAASANAGKTADTETFRMKWKLPSRRRSPTPGNDSKTIDGCEHNPFGIGVSLPAPLTTR